MKTSVAQKVGLSVFCTTLAVSAVASVLSFQSARNRIADADRLQSEELAQTTLAQFQAQIDHYWETAQILREEPFGTTLARKKFLGSLLKADTSLMGMTFWERHYLIPGKWSPTAQVNRPGGELDSIDRDFPLNLKTVADGKPELLSAVTPSGRTLLRLGVPVFDQGKTAFLLSFEIDLEIFQKRLHPSSAGLSFLLDQKGLLLTQSSQGHFHYHQSFADTDIYEAATTAESEQGASDFRDPGNHELQVGGFARHPDLGVIAVAAVPDSALKSSLTRTMFPMALGSVLAAAGSGVLAVFLTFGWIGFRLRRIRRLLMKIENGVIPKRIPGRSIRDEFGKTFQAIQDLCDALRKKETIQGPMGKLARINDPELRAKIERGKLNHAGEKTQAAVVHCHLHGLDGLVAKANAEKLIGLLNAFNEAVSETIETSGGIVDHIHEGSIVAFFGVPTSSDSDVIRAIQACLKIRKNVSDLNANLAKLKLEPVKLGMGVHYGTVVVGQVGTKDRMEYTAIGEPLAVASRIHGFGDQLGTDLLVTEQAVHKSMEKNGGAFPFEKATSGDEVTPALYELPSTYKAASDQLAGRLLHAA